ncbi:MAG: phosphoribosylamine--glycine ligase, partial [Thermoleophilia bacterium]|nr:phosphoribosylamine--glycine ligase [Thermoleophilia bacterium]
MKVLVVGGGGREHALVRALRRSPRLTQLYCAPGNAGIAREVELVPLAAEDVDGLAAFAERERIDLTVVGPEAPLVAGLADELRRRGLAVFGPGQEGAQLEGSKSFAKEVMEA